MYSFSNLEPVCCYMSSSNLCFLTCIHISQEAVQVVWSLCFWLPLFSSWSYLPLFLVGPGVNPSVQLLGEMLLFTLRAHLLVNTCLHFCWVRPWSGIAGSLGLLCFCFLFCQILDPAKQLLERVAWICIPCPVGVLGVLFPPILGTVSFVSAISMSLSQFTNESFL